MTTDYLALAAKAKGLAEEARKLLEDDVHVDSFWQLLLKEHADTSEQLAAAVEELVAERDALAARVKELEAEREPYVAKRLRDLEQIYCSVVESRDQLAEALRWYAQEWLYDMPNFSTSEPTHIHEAGTLPSKTVEIDGNPVQHDRGRLARDALAKLGSKP